MNKEISRQTSWGFQEIKNRCMILADRALKIWRGPLTGEIVSHPSNSNLRNETYQLCENTISICSNKESGEYFICLDEPTRNELLLITPKGDIKLLDSFLFNEPFEIDESDGLSKNLINKEQIRKYRYRIDRENSDKDPGDKPGNSNPPVIGKKPDYRDIVDKYIRNLDKKIDRLTFLLTNGKTIIFRYSKFHPEPQNRYFFGFPKKKFESFHPDKIFLILICGSTEFVLILPGREIARLFEDVPTDQRGQWKINIFGDKAKAVMQCSGKNRVDLTAYVNRWDLLA